MQSPFPSLPFPSIYFLYHWNISYTWNMSLRRETSPVLITAQPNKPVLHNFSNIAIFTWGAEPVMYSCAAFPHVSQTPTEQAVLHRGHNGWFDLKRSNYPQQWSDLIVYWWRRESVIEVKLEVIVSGMWGKMKQLDWLWCLVVWEKKWFNAHLSVTGIGGRLGRGLGCLQNK